jgi:hypothetical protein
LGITRSGSLKKKQIKKVAARPIRDNVTSPKSANTAVVNTEANIKGYPALANGKAELLGTSDQKKLLISYALVDLT